MFSKMLGLTTVGENNCNKTKSFWLVKLKEQPWKIPNKVKKYWNKTTIFITKLLENLLAIFRPISRRGLTPLGFSDGFRRPWRLSDPVMMQFEAVWTPRAIRELTMSIPALQMLKIKIKKIKTSNQVLINGSKLENT